MKTATQDINEVPIGAADERLKITIKNVSREIYNLFRACAVRQGVPLGEWFERAVRHQAALEGRGSPIIPPGASPPSPAFPAVLDSPGGVVGLPHQVLQPTELVARAQAA